MRCCRFTGTVSKGTTSYQIFTVQQQGQVDLTLTKTDPLATVTLGIGISQTSANLCIPVLLAYNNAAQAGTVMSGTAAPGSYCTVVYDVGNVSDTVNYTVTVVHP